MGDAGGFETTTYSVMQLLEAVREGRVRIPLFQRGFVWTDEDRRLLFDSIQEGYPIGTFLLAKGEAKAATLRLGEYQADVPATRESLWVVDGQQRLSTLAMSLLGEHTGDRRPIYFDLETTRFVMGPRRRAPPPRWVPSHVIGSSKTLNRWLRDAQLPDDLNDRADSIAGRIRDYKVPAYIVPYDGRDDGALKEIFARTNRRGRSLKSHEVFEALHMDEAGVKPIQRVDMELARFGFGSLGESAIERSALAIAGRLPGKLENLKLEGPDNKPINVPKLFARVGASLAKVIKFLVDEADVPHVEYLPYAGVVPALARFFDLHPEPHSRNIELLGRWFWRGTLNRDHQTDNGVDGRKWRAIDSDEHGSIQRLLHLLPPVADVLLDGTLHTFGHSAGTRIELLAMCAAEPRVLVGEDRGEVVPIASLIGEDKSNVATIIDGGYSPRTCAHYLIHPAVRASELRANPPDAALLATHLIDPTAWDAFMGNDMAAFLAQRTEALQRHQRELLQDRVGRAIKDHDRPPLDSYFGEESA